MSIEIMLTLNGVPVPVELDDAALAAIADALAAKHEPEPDWPQWMDTPTAARYCGCTVGRIQKLKQRGLIRSHQEGKGCAVTFNRNELDDDMANLNHRDTT